MLEDSGRKRGALNQLRENSKKIHVEVSRYGISCYFLCDTFWCNTNFICLIEHDVPENFRQHRNGHDGAEGSEHYDDHDDDMSDNQSLYTDTPITPFSPPQAVQPRGKTIKCTWEGCERLLDKPARLESHLRSHKNERPFVCSYPSCNKSYMEAKHLTQHVKGSHIKEKTHQCKWEGCKKAFLTATRLRRHIGSHEGRERFRCNGYPPCDQAFRKHHTLQSHIRAAHLGLAPYYCTQVDPVTQVVCDAGFDSAAALRKHADRVHGPPRFWCDECSDKNCVDGTPKQAIFLTRRELEKHMSTEHSNCMFCDLKCSGERKLQKHVETYHTSPDIPQENKDLAEKKIVQCPECDKTFTRSFNLLVHRRSAHEGQRFLCLQSTCDLFKSAEFAFWTGESACGKEFVSKANLKDHIRTQHLGLPSAINSRRVKALSTASGPSESANDILDDPISIITGINYDQNAKRKYACIFRNCAWRFTRLYDLKRHIETKHPMTVEEREKHGIHFEDTDEEDEEYEDEDESGRTDSRVQSVHELENDTSKGLNTVQELLALNPEDIVDDGLHKWWEMPLESAEEIELRRKQWGFWHPEEVEAWLPPQ
jgi:general transcription factor IIIA